MTSQFSSVQFGDLERSVRGPLKLLKEKWLNAKTGTNLLDYVSKFKYRQEAQTKIKTWYAKVKSR